MSSAWFQIQVMHKLDLILKQLGIITQKEDLMSVELDALTAQVAAQSTVEQSAITLLNGLSTQIATLVSSGGTPTQFTALATSLKTSADSLAAAVVSNTPAAPTPGPAPAPSIHKK